MDWRREIHVYLREHCLTIYDFAWELRVSPSTVSNWLNYNSEPNRRNRIKIQNLLSKNNHGKINKVTVI